MSEPKRSYPYDAWTLQPSFKPVKITLVGNHTLWSTTTYDNDAGGKSYALGELHKDKAAAIEYGRERIAEQLAIEAKRKLTINKRIAALDKGEKE